MTEAFTTYLNDHLAGSVAAIELVEHLAKASRETPRESLFMSLRAEIEEDQTVLKQLLRDSGAKESRVRKAAGWLTEKLAEVKLRMDDPGGGQLEMLQALEALALGINGKLALWRALQVLAQRDARLRSLDLARLERRAVEQHSRVETERLNVARAALAP